MKRLTLTGIALLLAIALQAQVEDDWKKAIQDSQNAAFKEFEQFQRQAHQEYEDFRRKANEEYAKFMEHAWKMFEIQAAEEPPTKPKPLVLPNLQFGRREYQHLQCETKTVSWHQQNAMNRVSTKVDGFVFLSYICD